MVSYKQELNGVEYIYYYDRYISLWTVFDIDEDGSQIMKEADHFAYKSQMLESYNFDFKTKE
jgi:hypothetical protein